MSLDVCIFPTGTAVCQAVGATALVHHTATGAAAALACLDALETLAP